MPISVKRVYWWTDWIANVLRALVYLWEAAFSCQHEVSTIRFQHLAPPDMGSWHVNECSKCGKRFEVLWWSK